MSVHTTSITSTQAAAPTLRSGPEGRRWATSWFAAAAVGVLATAGVVGMQFSGSETSSPSTISGGSTSQPLMTDAERSFILAPRDSWSTGVAPQTSEQAGTPAMTMVEAAEKRFVGGDAVAYPGQLLVGSEELGFATGQGRDVVAVVECTTSGPC